MSNKNKKSNKKNTGRQRITMGKLEEGGKCKFYRELDNILGHRPASVPAVLLDTGITNSSSSSNENLQGDDSTKGREEIETNSNNYTIIICSKINTVIHTFLVCQQIDKRG